MDIATILIGVAVFIISALMIYCISAFSMREKTYEEAMEEQRRRHEEEREKVKAEKRAEKDQHKKKYKKGKEKIKEKSAQVTEPELKIEHKMVNLDIEPEIIEPTESLGLNAGIRHRGKKEKSTKSILLNREEIALVTTEKAPEVRHKPVAPKDEVELKKVHEKVVVEKIEKVKAVPQQQVVEKIEKVKAVPQQQEVKEMKSKHFIESKENLPPKSDESLRQPKGTPKGTPIKQAPDDEEKQMKKAKQDDVQLNGSRLISSVKVAKLSDEEIQTLIEILLNRQGITPSSPIIQNESWNKKSQKGDPIPLLKKQLEEKERALQEEQNLAMAANSKVKEMRNELGAEKNKYAALEKRYQDKVNHQQAEMDALQQRMQHTHEQHLMETNGLQARLHQVEQEAGDQSALQKLSAENKVLQETLSLKAKENVSLGEKVKHFEKELNKMQANEATRKSQETKASSYEEKIQKLENALKDADSMSQKRLDEVSIQLRKSEGKNESLTADLQKATSAVGAAEAEVTTLKEELQILQTNLNWADASKDTSKEVEMKLEESERKRSDLEGNIKNLDKQLADSTKRLNDSKVDIQRLQQENRSLADENRIIKEKVQAAPAPNGDIHDQNGPSLTVEEHEQIVAKKDEEVSALTTSLESQKKSTASLQVQMDTQKAQMSELQEQLTQQKAKNNELRQKNWKAIEALEKAEKSSAEKVDKALKSARELSMSGAVEIETCDKAVFQRLFPDVQVADKLPHKDWVVAFEKQAYKKLQSCVNEDRYKALEEKSKKYEVQVTTYESQVLDLNTKCERLQQVESELSNLKSKQSSQADENESEKKRLKEEVENYRSIVSETENKLKQLEKSIDAEEKKWKEKLKQAESSSAQNPDAQKRISELTAIVQEQEKQMEEYRNVLSIAENSLKQLEGKVVSEEKSWQRKYSSSQTQLAQTQEELINLKKQVLETRGSQEMQAKLEDLETELKESQDRIVVLTSEKETLVEKVTTVDTSSIQKEVTDLRSQMETERRKNKDLSLNVVKLKGIIKTGQDSLSQEQELVKKLQEQLDHKSVNSTASEADQIEQLRIKLSEKQKLLEREMSANKQLSERLAQLGVLAATSNDNGTSV